MAKAWLEPLGNPAQKLTLLALCWYADGDGRSRPSVEHLSQLVGVRKAAISNHLWALEAGGLIVTERDPVTGGPVTTIALKP